MDHNMNDDKRVEEKKADIPFNFYILDSEEKKTRTPFSWIQRYLLCTFYFLQHWENFSDLPFSDTFHLSHFERFAEA